MFKTPLLLLAAAGALAAGGQADAAPRMADELYLAGVGVQANAELLRQGVPPVQKLSVRATLIGDRLVNVKVSPSTGDAAADRAIEKALRKAKLAPAPFELSGGEITIAVTQAKAGD